MRLRYVVALAILATVAGSVVWQRASIERLWRRAKGPMPAPFLVVLPLEAEGDSADTLFAQGLTQDLSARLGQTPGIKALGRSGMTRLTALPLASQMQTVDASAALKGRVRRSGHSVRLSLELIAASDRASVWADDFSGDITDVFALESKAAFEIADTLKAEKWSAEAFTDARPKPVDPRAVEPYFRGLAELAARKPLDAAKSFDEAAAADPNLVEAFAGIVIALQDVNVEEGIPDDPARVERMRAAADKAFQLNPESARVNLAKGLTTVPLAESLARLKRAIDLDPSNALALQALGDVVRDADPDRALAFYDRALTADPFLETAHIGNVITNLLMRREGQAKGELLRMVVEHSPSWSLAFFPVFDMTTGSYGDAFADLMTKTPPLRERPYFLAQLVDVLAVLPKTYIADPLTEAQAAIKKFPGDCEVRAAYAGVLADRGRMAEARDVAQPLLAPADGDSARESTIRCAMTGAAALGDGEKFAALLNRILEREDLFKDFSFASRGQPGRLLLMGKIYPWTKVVDLPPVAEARGRMDAALEQQHEIIRTALGPIAYK